MGTQKKYVDYDNEAYIWEKTKNKFVAKENGKGLSEANYTQTEKAKLEGIQSGAEANVNADWDAVTGDAAILNKPTALSDFTDDVTVQPDWSESDNSEKDYIKNKPTALSAFTNDLSDATTSSHGLMASADKTKLDGIASGAEVNVQADWNETTTTSDAYIANKPQNLVQDANYVHITVDNSMSDSSGNPISNSVVKSYIDNAIGSVVGISFEKVTTLPATGENGVIYLVPNSGASPNSYDEYVWITVDGTSKFEKIGTTDVDLSGYVLSSDLVPLTTAEIDAICI